MTSLARATAVAIDSRLQSTDFTVEAGQMVAVIGPNGGGKTSLLRAVARTEDAVGTVIVDERDLDRCGEIERRKLVAFMPASRDAPWSISVADYIALGLGQLDAARIDSLIAALELDPLAGRPIDRLSTGERARVMLARALASKARLLLLDEPLSNLDPYWVLRAIDLLRSELVANASSALVSVHDLMLVERFDRVLLVSSGAVTADGEPLAVMGSGALSDAFRIEPDGATWRIRRG